MDLVMVFSFWINKYFTIMKMGRFQIFIVYIVICFDQRFSVSYALDLLGQDSGPGWSDGSTTKSPTWSSYATQASKKNVASNSSNTEDPSDHIQGSGFAAGDANGVKLSLEELKKLQADLLDGYDVTLRPRMDQSKIVEVNLTVKLSSVVEFDTTGQRFSIMGYFFVRWIDDVIQWNSSLHGGTYNMKLPLSKIWFPPLVISKTDGGSISVGNSDIDRATITAEGKVTWAPDGVYNVMCKVSVRYYPFDTQTCKLLFYISDEDITSVKLIGDPVVQTDYYLENSEWHLVEVLSKTEERFYTHFVTIEITVERRPGFTVYTMILPLCTLAILNIFSFLIPIESGEKGGHAITLFLAYGFFITITRDSLPHNSVQVSFYVVYIAILLLLSVFTVIYVVIEYKIYSTMGTRPFSICRLMRLGRAAGKKVAPVSDDDDHPVKVSLDSDVETCTWTDVMGKVDIFMSVSSAIFVFLVSLVLWTIVVHGQ